MISLEVLKVANNIARDLERKERALEQLAALESDQQIPPGVISEVDLDQRKDLCRASLNSQRVILRDKLRSMGIDPDTERATEPRIDEGTDNNG